MGGYFICNGIERIIRCLVQQRRHYVMALRRSAYHKRGANYTALATLVRWRDSPPSALTTSNPSWPSSPPPVLPSRCVREDQSSATVRCHYLTDGTVNFAFTMRRSEYFIPAGLLLKCFLDTSDRCGSAQIHFVGSIQDV